MFHILRLVRYEVDDEYCPSPWHAMLLKTEMAFSDIVNAMNGRTAIDRLGKFNFRPLFFFLKISIS